MKRVLQTLGIIVFWLAWPFWYFYFKFSQNRSRVLVVSEGKILVLKGWLGSGKWGLPGGGAHKSEKLIESAIRELKEEVGINTPESALQKIGNRLHKSHGLSYRAYYFVLELNNIPAIKLRKIEISEAIWVNAQDIHMLNVDNDVAYALKKFKPLNQAELF